MANLIRLLLEAAFLKYEDAKESIGKHLKSYQKSLLILLLVMIFPPMILIWLGISSDSKCFIVIGGTWRAICTLFLLVAITPFGIVLEIVMNGISGSGRRYVRFISGCFIGELIFTLVLCFIPIKNNPQMFPPLVLASFLFGLIGAFKTSRQTASAIVGIMLFLILSSFFFPNTFMSVREKIDDLDIGQPQLIKISPRDLKEEKLDFFRADGKPKVWYAKIKGKYELFDRPGFHPTYNIKLEPINTEIALEISSEKEKVLSFNNLNETRIAEKPNNHAPISELPNTIPNRSTSSINPPSSTHAPTPTPQPTVIPAPKPTSIPPAGLSKQNRKPYKYAVEFYTGNVANYKLSQMVASWIGREAINASRIPESGRVAEFLVFIDVHLKIDNYPMEKRCSTLIKVKIIDLKSGETIKSFSKMHEVVDISENTARQIAIDMTMKSLREDLAKTL